jgi:hypothetical protein
MSIFTNSRKNEESFGNVLSTTMDFEVARFDKDIRDRTRELKRKYVFADSFLTPQE